MIRPRRSRTSWRRFSRGGGCACPPGRVPRRSRFAIADRPRQIRADRGVRSYRFPDRRRRLDIDPVGVGAGRTGSRRHADAPSTPHSPPSIHAIGRARSMPRGALRAGRGAARRDSPETSRRSRRERRTDARAEERRDDRPNADRTCADRSRTALAGRRPRDERLTHRRGRGGRAARRELRLARVRRWLG